MSAALALWIYLALLLLLRGVLGLVPSMWGWGLNVQRFLDPFFGWGLWGAAVLTLVPAIARRSMESLEGFGDFLTRSSRAYLWAGLFGAALTWMMPDRVWFVGDFLIRLGNVESGKFSGNYISALPLDRFLHSALLHVFGKGSAEAANLALRALGAVEGGGFAVLAVVFARALGVTGAMAVLGAGVAFFGGYLTMFTGLGKPASEMCLATLGLAAFGIGAIRNRSSLWPCGLVMAIALGLHRSSVMLLPAWGTVVGAWVRANPGAWKRPRNGLAIALPLAVAAFAIPRIVAIATGYDLSHHVMTAESRREGGLWVEVFSPRHLLDLANLFSALSPLALAIPVLLRFRDRESRTPSSTIPLVLALSFVPALLLIEPQQGIFRDWDVFAPAAAAFSALAATLLADRLATTPARAWLAVPALALVAMSSLQWLAVNRQESRGLERVRAYLLEPPWPEEEDRPLVWDFVASRNMRLHRWSAAADAAAHAAVDEPSPRILTMWAISSTLAEDHDEAEQVYRRLLEREPEDPLAWLGLAGEARRLHHEATLDSAMSRLRSYAPEGPEMKKIRVHLRYFPQVWPAPDSVEGWSPARGARPPAGTPRSG